MPETVSSGDPQRVEARTPGTPEALSDPELINGTRRGDTTAYAVLYERHVHAARRLARILARDSASADDLVSETFAKLLHTFREGGGPDLAFRPYMLQTLRNTFYDRIRRDKRVEFTDDFSEHDSGEIYVDPAVEGQERRYAALAFGKLPERWQMVLWHTEVEEDSPAKIATMLGMTANGVSALAYRAREKLRQNYLTEHAADSPPEACRWTVDRMGARVRGKLGVRDVEKVDEHLQSCVSCNLLFAELTELNSGLRVGAIAAIFLGTAAAPYLAAGAAAAAGVAVGGAFAVLFTPFRAVANWVRRIVQQLGTKGSVATGTTVVVAVAVAATIFALTSGEPEEEPQAADEPPISVPDEEPPASEEDDPEQPEEDPADDPAPEETEPDADEPADEPSSPAAVPASYGIEHALGDTGFTAGEEAILPIRLEAPASASGYAPRSDQSETAGDRAESAEAGAGAESGTAAPAAFESGRRVWGQAASSGRVTLDLTLPAGVTLTAEDAEPGWRCADRGAEVRCTIPELPDPAVADVRINIGAEVSGYQAFTVTVDGPGISGTTELRIPVAPSGSQVGFASLDASGVIAAGNTWLTCAVPGCKEATALGAGERWPMKPYKPRDPHPEPPAGKDGDAVSGAVLDIPGGSEVIWAGLYWAGVHEDVPTEVSLAGPGGGWSDLGAASVIDTEPGAQAFVEVTGIVEGGGEYWAAVDNHALPTSECGEWPADSGDHCLSDHWAGWSLAVVYAEPGAETREVAVYDGARSADTEIEVRGVGKVTVAHTLWGGSGYARSDALSIGGQDVGEPATCTAAGAVNNPHWYTFGVDVAVNSVDLGEDSVIRFTRGDDPFVVGVVAVAAPSE
ncbi:sigma-70 family RNA polymerase sigma factor [Glycomyces buryatensis]|uniref:Sigma-70 family RNA polymerase sigma factor n=1 Tax=Glycomyces buryatensis TaxID=2570927 RepID=A0A4S8QER9_9ACTN|nr:sigma-70 family RNA polymerase sigma factor [Glycomyces buryatensis]THV43137.1 sigma-70 family RNA polymerase sigma factor [Glycomyces buryatensis]